MPVLAKMALGVVAGGVALGSLLGAAADPVMKRPPERQQQAALQAPVAVGGAYLVIAAPPEDLDPYGRSHAPTWAREELADWEPDYPAWTYSELVDERLADVSVAEQPMIEEQPVAATVEVTVPEMRAEPAVAASGTPVPSQLAGLY